ncbi:Levodione reductase [Elsinoe australis]|uniref:Levodione reductase n=1 Tax=Elsinoe australis TaxID=40998 RepID=A0A2P8A4N8_9PEZI|nr:Levodione reductase [Elsinoe australis]
MDVDGYALITGAASGIARACAHTFARDGCAGLALLDMNETALQTVKTEIEKAQAERGQKPCKVIAFPCNVTNEAQVDQIVVDVAKEFGRIDYVVNAAGIACKHEGGVAYAKTSDWQRVMDVNVNGTFYVFRAAAQIMLKQEPIKSAIDGRSLQRGSIVNFSSLQGLVGVSLSAAYTASKHAVIGMTKSASEDYAAQGLRINAVCPGYTATPLTMDNPAVKAAMDERLANGTIPIKRIGLAQEIADSVVFLAGGRSSFITGTALAVDGGFTQR